MKKLLLTLGTLAAVAAPVTTIVACGSTPKPANPNDKYHRDLFNPKILTGKGAPAKLTKDLPRTGLPDVADSQDDTTVYQSGTVDHKISRVIPITSDDIDLDALLSELSLDIDNISGVSFSIGTKYGVYANKITLSKLKKTDQAGSIKTGFSKAGFPTYYDGNIHFSLLDNGKVKLLRIPRWGSISTAKPFTDFSEMQITNFNAITRAQPYWGALKPTKVTPLIFYLNADDCHSLDDIFNQMDSQLHFYFKKSIGNMQPIDLADYIVNLARNNGGGDWTFVVNYKGEWAKAIVPTRITLNRFISALDGDYNPNGGSEAQYSAVSPKTTRGNSNSDLSFTAGFGHTLDNLDASQFMDMFQKHSNWLPKDHSPILNLLQHFPTGALNTFPDFLQMFMSVANVFVPDADGNPPKVDICQKWARDQDASVQARYKDAVDIFVKKVLASGT